MTHHKIRVMDDGTHVYSNGYRYKKKPKHLRKYQINKPDDPRAVLWSSRWWLPLDHLIDQELRVMPETRPDTDAYEHMMKRRPCKCYVCIRPESERWKDIFRAGRQMRRELL